jgi:hypothetical protein
MEFDVDRAVEILERTPAILREWLSGLSEPWLTGNEGPDTFSPHDVLAHLTDLEQTDWISRAKMILERGDTVAFEPVDRTAFRDRFRGTTTPELIGLFASRRVRNLQTLGALDLTPPALAKEGVHPALGRVTLAQLLATWAVHDLAHLAQISRTMARQYAEAVGPWREYLSVLRT